MSATIRDVAKRAGVGLGTVSRVLNNSPLVRDDTRRRVLEVIDELAYTPSRAARSLSLGKTLTIATIAPFFTRPSVVERLRGIEATLNGSAYNMVVFNIESVERRNSCLREVPRREFSDGVLILSLKLDNAEITSMREAGIRVVLIDQRHEGLPTIAINDVQGGHMATRHLIELGHRRTAFLGDPLGEPLGFTSSADRMLGYKQALSEFGLPIRESYIVNGPHGLMESRQLARQLLSLPEPPTAIFAASDTQAMGVLEAARELGRSVPHELSVIGFDDIEVAAYLNLTTIRQPLFETGVRGVELLLALMVDEPPTRISETMPIELIVRGTTARPSHES
jgi:DNA-binding LacI/PurR family transcriptional regulator